MIAQARILFVFFCYESQSVSSPQNPALSSIFLQGYDPPKNVNVVEANQALKRYCLTKGWDFIDHGNIAFKHLDKGGMHLTPEGNRLFARNLLAHTKSG